MEHIAVITKFNQIAIASKLTGLQMQLWYEIFLKVQASTQNLCISTAELLELLQVSRCQFQRARSGLVEAGLLSMRKVSNHKMFYTVQLNHEPVAVHQSIETAGTKEVPEMSMQKAADITPIPKFTSKKVSVSTNHPKSINIFSDDSYRAEIIKFCGNLYTGNIATDVQTLETELMNWCMMRKENGWNLTMQGLQVLLKKLTELSAQNVCTMLKIVRMSIHRRWKGFYELRPESKPSGKQLLALEQKEQKSSSPYYREYYNDYYNKRNRRTTGRIPKYDKKKEDLDFLEW